jgi:hypothetical protein
MTQTERVRASPRGLFNAIDIDVAFGNVENKALARVKALAEPTLLEESTDGLTDRLLSDLLVEPVSLAPEQLAIGQPEVVAKDVRSRDGVYISDYSHPVIRDFHRTAFHVPFTGDADIFNLNPSVIHTSIVPGEVTDSEIVLRFEQPSLDVGAARAEADRAIAEIEPWVGRVNRRVVEFQTQLRGRVIAAIDVRRESVADRERQLLAQGAPVRRPGDSRLMTFPIRMERKGGAGRERGTAPIGLDPTLLPADFENILYLIQNMGRAMERDPGAYSSLSEEPLRTQFLVQLAGQFPATATGETFSGAGKTDIHLTHQGHHVFTAECKFWTGPKGFVGALDQLLGYAVWRDTKLALIIFNRNQDLTAVVRAAREAVAKHSLFIATLPDKGETSLRFKFRNPKDHERFVNLAIEFFDLKK